MDKGGGDWIVYLYNSSMAPSVSVSGVPWSGACRYIISTLATCTRG
jgi:hypothetical protein